MNASIPDVVTLLFAIGAAQGFFLSTILFFRDSSKRTADRLMALIVLLYSYQLIYIFLTYSGWIKHLPHLFGSTYGILFLLTALFYLYSRSFFAPARGLSIRDVLHFLPYIALACYHFRFYLLPSSIKLKIYEMDMAAAGIHPFSWTPYLVNILQIVHVSVYLFLSFRLYRNNQDSQPGRVRQFFWILVFFSLFAAGSACYSLFIPVFRIGYYSSFCYGIKLFMAGSLYALAYRSYLKPPTQREEEMEIKKYRNSPLTKAQSQLLAERIEAYLEAEKPFLASTFKLSSLSAFFNVPVHYISQAINENFECSFPDYINRHRIEEAKRMLRSQEEKIIAVAFDCGFNNKVSFNNAFKKQTGMTPGDYRRHLMEVEKTG